MPYSYWTERLLEAWCADLQRPKPPSGRDPLGVVLQAMGVIDLLGRALHVVEIDDRPRDEVIGWVLVVEEEGYLDVEDLFVRPAYRGQGRGRELADEIRSLSRKRGMPLRYWIPHADWSGWPTPAQAAIFHRLGLSLVESPERWAAKLACSPA